MKKYLMLLSIFLCFIFNSVVIKSESPQKNVENEVCTNRDQAKVGILDTNKNLKGNGFVYKEDNSYLYIVTTSDIYDNTKKFDILFHDGYILKSSVIGYDLYNQIMVLKTEKKENVSSVCFANTNHIYKGQLIYSSGYYDENNSFTLKGIINEIGNKYSKDGYKNIFRNIVQINYNHDIKGSGVYDEIGRLVGMITGSNEKLEGSSFVVETNKITKVADSIIKYGKYSLNYIEYSLEDYSSLKTELKESYKINDAVSSGVVITTFRPLKYVFGGLNQGMVIVAVNGVAIKNIYELDKQLTRYEKDDNVCLKVIKKNGKTGFYYVKV